jgi:hypothetical protein
VDAAIPMHRCVSTKGLLTPLIREGTTAKIEVVERQDYVGKDKAQTDADGRPIMSVVTTRDEGQDCVVFPAAATASATANEA